MGTNETYDSGYLGRIKSKNIGGLS